jgi:hypothetical protein
MTPPALQAAVDQWAAAARDHYDHWQIDIEDIEVRKALMAAFLWFDANRHAFNPALLGHAAILRAR